LKKKCLDCKNTLDATWFGASSSPNSKDGLKVRCLDCENRPARRLRAARKKLGQLMHVPLWFIEALYLTPVCHYCHKFTERKQRTMDHKVPLEAGGPHHESNLVMACRSCNTSKGSRSAEEFMREKGL
jgi:5-methylcytosine-specific restriction endonuclease McrA